MKQSIPTITVLNRGQAAVPVPYNKPEELAAAALAEGVSSLKDTSQTEFLAALRARPAEFTCVGAWHAPVTMIKPGETALVDPNKLLGPALTRLRAALEPGGSLEIVP